MSKNRNELDKGSLGGTIMSEAGNGANHARLLNKSNLLRRSPHV